MLHTGFLPASRLGMTAAATPNCPRVRNVINASAPLIAAATDQRLHSNSSTKRCITPGKPNSPNASGNVLPPARPCGPQRRCSRSAKCRDATNRFALQLTASGYLPGPISPTGIGVLNGAVYRWLVALRCWPAPLGLTFGGCRIAWCAGSASPCAKLGFGALFGRWSFSPHCASLVRHTL